MTWILLAATSAVLLSIGLACVRAHLEAETALCDCLSAFEPLDVTAHAPGGQPGVADEGTQAGPPDGAVGQSPRQSSRPARHLRVVGAWPTSPFVP